jgi:hypothetical protein
MRTISVVACVLVISVDARYARKCTGARLHHDRRPWASATCHVVSTLRVTSWASTVSGPPFVASCSSRASSPTLKSLEPQPLGPAASTLRVTSLASTLPGESLMASCLSRAASPPLMSPAPHPPSPSGSTLGVTSLASTRLGASIMASCFTRALFPPLMSLAPPPQGPSGSTLRGDIVGQYSGWRHHSWLPA